ncbi:MAG: hypothetical protein H6Q13_3320 [Bacteroidetes bacterium]|nr:hypothetical protein [Bacteroidota bacterium]
MFNNNIHTVSKSKTEAKTDYNRIILVYDSYRKEIIGGAASYLTGRPSNQEFKKIIKETVQELYKGNTSVRSDNSENPNSEFNRLFGGDYFTKQFHSFWGIPWATKIEDVIIRMKDYGYFHYSDNGIGIYYSDAGAVFCRV